MSLEIVDFDIDESNESNKVFPICVHTDTHEFRQKKKAGFAGESDASAGHRGRRARRDSRIDQITLRSQSVASGSHQLKTRQQLGRAGRRQVLLHLFSKRYISTVQVRSLCCYIFFMFETVGFCQL